MKNDRFAKLFLCLSSVFTVAALSQSVAAEEFVLPARGGGLDTTAPMIHVDIAYDYQANRMDAVLDTSHGVPSLTPLPAGYAFDSRSNYFVLSGMAYNFQYAWNPGAIFSPPEGGAVWIECLSLSDGLLTYDGPGNKNENPARPYTGIFGSDGSATLWQWYGRMAHNSYAVDPMMTGPVSATYRVYFGEAQTGVPLAGYDDATVTLTWTVAAVPEPGVLSVMVLGGVLAFLKRSTRSAQR